MLMIISILKFILVVVILAMMVLILLGINHLFAGNFTANRKDTEQLRRDVENSENVITRNNIFHTLVRKSEQLDKVKSQKVV